MKYTFKNEIKCSNNMKVYYELAVSDYTLTKKVEVMVQDECGRLTDVFSISLKQLVTCKSVLNQFFDYGFSHEDVVKITEKLKKAATTSNFAKCSKCCSIEEIYEQLTKYAVENELIKMIDGVEYCMIPTADFKAWVNEEVEGFAPLKLINSFEMMGLMKHNTGRKDYKRNADDVRCYCIKKMVGLHVVEKEVA